MSSDGLVTISLVEYTIAKVVDGIRIGSISHIGIRWEGDGFEEEINFGSILGVEYRAAPSPSFRDNLGGISGNYRELR